MTSILERYTDYFDAIRARGGCIITYSCPACKKSIDTRPAPIGQTWDTLATCPHCNGLHMKITKGDTAEASVP